MPGQSFRFLHAGGFRLDATLHGLHDAPEHLLETLVQAPLAAAENVFQAAVREEVDFVVLSGDLLDPTLAGPRAVALLSDQFRQLRKRGVSVYWAASQRDLTDNWLPTIEWPDNVHVFSSDKAESFDVLRGTQPLARVWGRSWHESRRAAVSDFPADGDGFALAVLPGGIEFDPRAKSGIRYWALGGASESETPSAGRCCIHLPGAPQGIASTEGGAHGCSLVHVSVDGEARVRSIPTDVVRWSVERIQVAAGAARETVHAELRSRLHALLSETPMPLLLSWKVSGLGRFDSRFARARCRDETLDWLRRQFGYGSPACWSVNFELEPPHALRAEWCEEDSILGDFMRVVRDFQDDPQRPLSLDPLLIERRLPPGIPATVLTAVSFEQRDELLNHAALIGLDLLRGDDALPHGQARSAQ